MAYRTPSSVYHSQSSHGVVVICGPNKLEDICAPGSHSPYLLTTRCFQTFFATFGNGEEERHLMFWCWDSRNIHVFTFSTDRSLHPDHRQRDNVQPVLYRRQRHTMDGPHTWYSDRGCTDATDRLYAGIYHVCLMQTQSKVSEYTLDCGWCTSQPTAVSQLLDIKQCTILFLSILRNIMVLVLGCQWNITKTKQNVFPKMKYCPHHMHIKEISSSMSSSNVVRC